MFIGYLIVAPVVCLLITFLIKAANIDEEIPHGLYQSLLTTYLISFAVIAVYEAIYFYDQLKKSLIEKEAVKREQIKAELQGLRNQVNPHFLFNSLNTVLNLSKRVLRWPVIFYNDFPKCTGIFSKAKTPRPLL